ncbi:hypothetical protein ACKVMT_04630 [Halobacteriales archaeon Cl-PHB]
MTIRASESTRPDDCASESGAGFLSKTREVKLQIEGDRQLGRKSGFSILLRGDVTASSILSSNDPSRSVMELENDTKLLAGNVRGGTAGFVLEGAIVAAEFDEPAPTVKLDGTVVDPAQWPTVKEVTGHGNEADQLSSPFTAPDEAALTPAEPTESVVTLDATDLTDAVAYGVDVQGDVVDHPDTATVPESGDRIYGYLFSGNSVTIEVAGAVTRVDVPDGVEVTVQSE